MFAFHRDGLVGKAWRENGEQHETRGPNSATDVNEPVLVVVVNVVCVTCVGSNGS